MDITASFYLKILSDYINDRETEIPEGVNWDKLILIAENEGTEGLLYYMLKKHLSGEILEKLKKAYIQYGEIYDKYAESFEDVKEKLTEYDVDFFNIKGLFISGCYDEPNLRGFCDLDLVVKEENFKKVIKAFKELGYIQQDTFQKDVLSFVKDDELCYDISPNIARGPIVAGTESVVADLLWNQGTNLPGSTEKDVSVMLQFLCATNNVATRVILGLVKLRNILDIAVILKNYYNEIDWDLIDNVFGGTRSMEILQGTIYIVKEILDFDVPFGNKSEFYADKESIVYKSTAKYINSEKIDELEEKVTVKLGDELDKESEAVIKILNSYVTKADFANPKENINEDTLKSYIHHQKLTNIAKKTCNISFPDEEFEGFKIAYTDAYETKKRTLSFIDSVLSEANIEYIPFTNEEVFDCYEENEDRYPFDPFTLIIHDEDKEKVVKLIGEAIEKNQDELKKNSYIDFGFNIFDNVKVLSDENLNKFKKYIWSHTVSDDTVMGLRLDVNAQFIYYIVHYLLESNMYGFSCNTFMDIYLYYKKHDICLEELTDTLKDLGLYDALKAINAFMEKIIGVTLPFEKTDVDKNTLNYNIKRMFMFGQGKSRLRYIRNEANKLGGNIEVF